ncbi:hypothetical protein NE237_022871 [Protea cynaroides]|uniref:SKP1-like protein n=1 Tax=Protea cynaroides TaxID=273540 RepID=A0A9Q0HAN3_9MAGN|nr:hypothetical protein NE237_022871 [Protea cynaroides]
MGLGLLSAAPCTFSLFLFGVLFHISFSLRVFVEDFFAFLCLEIMSLKKVTLKSSDGETFDIDKEVALESQTIKHMIEDDCADNGIPLPNVTSKILARVIEYCKKHVETPKSDDRTVDEELKSWDAEFVKVDQATLFDLILAANYLNIKSLLDLTCQTVADMIKGKTPEEIRKTFNIKNDFTPEEEEEVRRENQWAFE